jgi:predicted phosphodiesterase
LDKKLVSEWEMMSVDANKEPQVTTLHKYVYPDETVDVSQFVTQAKPTRIYSNKTIYKPHSDRLLADVPDIHFGIRNTPEGLVATHRPEILDVWLQIMKDANPDVILLGGDMIDLPELSKYSPDSRHFLDTIQQSIDGLYIYFSKLRADNPNAKIVALSGNHETRFNKTMIRNSMSLFGVKPACMPSEFSTTSFPFFLRLKDLEIEWISGYPAESFQINDNLRAVHGDMSKTNTALDYIRRDNQNTLFHHTHRREYGTKTYSNGESVETFSFGCQADISGSVPAVHNGVDDMGKTVIRFENWQNGGGFVEYSDKYFKPEFVPINHPNYTATRGDRLYAPRI